MSKIKVDGIVGRLRQRFIPGCIISLRMVMVSNVYFVLGGKITEALGMLRFGQFQCNRFCAQRLRGFQCIFDFSIRVVHAQGIRLECIDADPCFFVHFPQFNKFVHRNGFAPFPHFLTAQFSVTDIGGTAGKCFRCITHQLNGTDPALHAILQDLFSAPRHAPEGIGDHTHLHPTEF